MPSRRRLLSISVKIALRESPAPLGPGRIRPYTLVAMTTSSRRPKSLIAECDSMAGKMLVVATAHTGDDDVTLDQLVVKPCTAEAGSVGANPAQFCSPRQQLG